MAARLTGNSFAGATYLTSTNLSGKSHINAPPNKGVLLKPVIFLGIGDGGMTRGSRNGRESITVRLVGLGMEIDQERSRQESRGNCRQQRPSPKMEMLLSAALGALPMVGWSGAVGYDESL